MPFALFALAWAGTLGTLFVSGIVVWQAREREWLMAAVFAAMLVPYVLASALAWRAFGTAL